MNNDQTPELLNISYCEDDNGLPLLNINNDISISITNRGFLAAVINNTLLKCYWRFNNIRTGKLTFSIDNDYTHHYSPDTVTMSLFLDRDFVGLVNISSIYDFATKAMAKLKSIKIEVEREKNE